MSDITGFTKASSLASGGTAVIVYSHMLVPVTTVLVMIAAVGAFAL